MYIEAEEILQHVRQEGAFAYRDNISFEDCPYKAERSKQSWQQGWADERDAQYEERTNASKD